MSRVVVVGAGIGGLAVAARLARLRHDVVVVERADTVGGKLGVFSRDGFTFDTGPSLVTLPATLRDLFLKTGKAIETVLDLQPVEPIAHYQFPDGSTLDLPNTGQRDVVAAFDAAMGPRAADDWRRFHRHAERTWDVVRGPFVEAPLGGLRDLARLAVSRPTSVPLVAPWRTLRALGRRSFRDERQRMFLDRYATYAGSDPRHAPAVLSVIPYVEQTFGAWSVVGGMRQIAVAIADRARRCGAQILTDADVVQISAPHGRIEAVRLADGRNLPADVVVSDVDATTLYTRLLPHTASQRRLAAAQPSLSGFVLMLGVRGRTPGLSHHSVLFGDDYDAEFDAVFGDSATPVADPTLYVCVPTDPGLAPDGDESWFVLVNAARHGRARACVDWDEPGLASSYAEHLLGLLAARGLDVRDRLAFAEWRSPADLERATASPGGAIYGSSSNGWRAAFLRPANRSPVPGLFLVGGSAHPGGGLPLVLMSAAIVADMIGRA